MSGAKPHLKPLEARRRLLVVESEINRAELLGEWQGLNSRVHGLAQQARSYCSILSTALAISTAFVAFRRVLPGKKTGRSSWISTLLKGARMGVSLWSAARERH